MGFQHDMTVAFDGRTGSDHGYRRQGYIGKAMHTGDENAGQYRVVMTDRDIGCREAQSTADFVAMHDMAGNGIGSSQQCGNGSEVTLFQRVADRG